MPLRLRQADLLAAEPEADGAHGFERTGGLGEGRGDFGIDGVGAEEVGFHGLSVPFMLRSIDQECGSALRPLPGRNLRFRKADTLARFMASHSD